MSRVKVNLEFPKFVFQKDLKYIADRIIVPDIASRMTKGIDLSGSPHPENTPKTRINKAIRGLKITPLIATGQLRKSFKVSLVKNGVIIFPIGLRKPYPKIKRKFRLRKSGSSVQKNMTNLRLAKILQVEGIRSGHKYEFFGISEKSEDRAIKYMIKKIKKAIKSGQRKFTK